MLNQRAGTLSGQTEFFLTDDDGYSQCFGVPTQG